MTKKLLPTLLFFILNFAALAVGGLFTGSGVSSEWYQNLDKAPWTPPGWVFGAAWPFIMICFGS
jgi:tryptophan-rich sensory protein